MIFYSLFQYLRLRYIRFSRNLESPRCLNIRWPKKHFKHKKPIFKSCINNWNMKKCIGWSKFTSNCIRSLISCVRERKKYIRRELDKFEKMKKVANGFGKTPHGFIKSHFGFRVVD